MTDGRGKTMAEQPRNGHNDARDYNDTHNHNNHSGSAGGRAIEESVPRDVRAMIYGDEDLVCGDDDWPVDWPAP